MLIHVFYFYNVMMTECLYIYWLTYDKVSVACQRYSYYYGKTYSNSIFTWKKIYSVFVSEYNDF